MRNTERVKLAKQQILSTASLLLTVWLLFCIHYDYSLPVIKMLTVGPPEKKTKIERNKRTNATQDPEKRNPPFSLTVQDVKREDEARLQSSRCRLDNAKSLLVIDRKTSLTQNADLLELVMPSAVIH